MSSSINPRDVLAQLNELGYQNITAQQLKEFVIDLKKLMKYDEKASFMSDLENIPPIVIPGPHFQPQAPVATKPKVQKGSVVSIKIKSCDSDCKVRNCNSAQKPEKQKQSVEQEANTMKVSTNSVGTLTSMPQKSCKSDCKKSNQMRVQFEGSLSVGKSSYIIPRNPIKSCKSDPVALFHKYQEGWKKHKLPGENNHANLRWAIRARMLGHPQAVSISAAPSMEVIAKNRKANNRI